MTDIEMIVPRLHQLGFPELTLIQSLIVLPGSTINLECRLPNGATGKILDDGKTYFAAQVEKADSDRCYGVAADADQLAVYEYGCNGADAVLVAWLKR